MKLPGGTGNQVPQSAGASLFILYRDVTQPLTKVIVYDGIFIQLPGQTMTQTIRGFLESTGSVGKMTQIAGPAPRI